MTIDEAIAVCRKLASQHPGLHAVIDRIKELRAERDDLHSLARKAMSDAAWEKSDMKKWADRQRDDPDND